MLTVSPSPRLSVALPARAVGLVLADHHGINRVIRVTLRAVRLRDIGCLESIATQQVFATRNRFEMVRVAAAANSAEMIELQAGRYGSDKGFENDGMRHPDQATARRPDLRVAITTERVGAQPASRDRADVDFRPDPVRQSRVAPGTIEHIDSTQSVAPRGVDAPAGLLAAILPVTP